MKTFPTIVGTCLLAVGLLPLLAPPPEAAGAADRFRRGGAGYIMIGGSLLDSDGLNAALEAGGYSRLPGSFLTMGGGGHAFIGRLVLGGEGQGLTRRRGVNAGSKPVLSGACGFFDIGYVVHSRRGLLIYPLFGVGAGSVDMRLQGRPAASFEEVLVDSGRSVRLQKSGFLMHLALGADQWLGSAGHDGRHGVFIGIRAGYAFAPVKSAWELEGTEIDGGPKAGWTGPYIRISIGAGGRTQ
jgi:hypothetical protein